LRRRNTGEWRRALGDLATAGRLRSLPAESELELLLGAIFVHCDHWLHFVETQDEEIDETAFAHGYETLLLLLGSYLTETGRAVLRRPAMVESAGAQFLAYITPAPPMGRHRAPALPESQIVTA